MNIVFGLSLFPVLAPVGRCWPGIRTQFCSFRLFIL